MGLRPCGECGREISTSAKACPNCGAKTRTQQLNEAAMLLLVAFLIIAVVGYCAVG